MPNTQAFIEALSKLGLNVLPYLKYVALLVGGFYVLVALGIVIAFVFIAYQFIKMPRNFR